MMEAIKTVRWVELMRLADEASELLFHEVGEHIEARLRCGELWYQAQAKMPLSPRKPVWGVDERGFAYRLIANERDYPNLAGTSWAAILAVEALRPEILAALNNVPAEVAEATEELIASYQYVSAIDSGAFDELPPPTYAAVQYLQQTGADPENEDELRWKLYLRTVRASPVYAALAAESQARLGQALILDRTTFVAELEARGFVRDDNE